jgi:hypothetical protein
MRSRISNDFGIVAQLPDAEGGWAVIAEAFSDIRREGEFAIEEAAANARLIASAQMLLEALQSMHQLAKLLAANCADRVNSDFDPAWKQFSDAITQATGEEP